MGVRQVYILESVAQLGRKKISFLGITLCHSRATPGRSANPAAVPGGGTRRLLTRQSARQRNYIWPPFTRISFLNQLRDSRISSKRSVFESHRGRTPSIAMRSALLISSAPRSSPVQALQTRSRAAQPRMLSTAI
eukprot:scaffold7381_cov310-Pinguiococcus_pyrenoidosus.AAC.24